MAITDARLLSGAVSGDEQARNLLGQQVARDVLNATGDDSVVEISPFTRNYYSVTFEVQVQTSDGSRQVFVKIPKKTCVLPLHLFSQSPPKIGKWHRKRSPA